MTVGKRRGAMKLPPESDSVGLALGGFGNVTFKSLVENLNDGFAVIDRQRKLVFSNPKFAAMLGYSNSDLIGIDVIHLFDDENQRVLIDELRKRAGGVSSKYEITFTSKTGDNIPVLMRASPILSEKNELIGSYAVITDMTLIKKVEHELLTEKGKLENIVKGIGAGLSLLDSDTRIIWANDILQKWFGPLDKLSGRPCYELYLLKDPKKECAALRTIRSGQTEQGEAFAYVIGGQKRYFQLFTTPIRDEDGNIVQILELTQDITEKKKLEAELQDYAKNLEQKIAERTQDLVTSEERYRNLVETSDDIIFVLNLDGTFAFVNNSAEKLTGYSKEEAMRLKFTDVLSKEYRDSTTKRFKSHMSDPSTYRYETQIVTKDGRKIDLEVATTPLIEEKEITAIQGIARDITERKRAVEALKLFRTLVDRSNDTIEVIDPETARFMDVNEKACRESGYSREELLSMRVFDIDPTVDQSTFTSAIEALKKSGVMLWEGVHRRKDGSTFPVEVNIKYVQLDRTYLVTVVRDITERKRAEEALRTSEEEWRNTFDSIPDLISIHNRDFRIVKVNKAFEEKFGIPRDKIEGKHCYEVFHARTSPWPTCPFERTIATGKTTIEDVEDPHLGGTFSIATSPLFKDGELIGSVHICRDITQRKEMEEEVRRSKEFLNNILTSSADAIITTDMKGKITSWSGGAERMYGYKSGDMIGKSIYDIYPATLKEERTKWFHELMSGKDVKDVRTQIYRADNSLVYITLSLSLLRDDKGQAIGTVGVSKDITDHVMAEKALKESEERFSRFSRATYEGLVIHDNGKILDVNQTLANMFGYEISEFIGKNGLELISPEYRDVVSENVRNGYEEPYEALCIKRGGSHFPVEIRAKKIPYKGRQVRLAAIRDITDRKKAEEELNKAHFELQKKLGELERFTKHAVGRELRMIELKNKIKDHEQRLERYEGKE